MDATTLSAPAKMAQYLENRLWHAFTADTRVSEGTKMMLKELGCVCEDKSTGLKGMVTHYHVESGDIFFYSFQPHGLNKETQQPLESTWIARDRLIGGTEVPEPDLHRYLLGTIVTDKASGFRGEVTALEMHINGCVHAVVQPKGLLAKTGERILACNFDIRRLSGAAVKTMTQAEKKLDQVKRPSPAGVTAFSAGRR